MNHFLRAFAVALTCAPLAISAGCSGGGGEGGDGGSGSTGTGAGAISWQGTWSAHLQYSVDCDYSFGNIKHADVDLTSTMVLDSNGNGGLTADIMGYLMSGTGNATSLSLSGQYPMQDEGGNIASDVQSGNNITFNITSVVDDNHAEGAVSGKFDGNSGNTAPSPRGRRRSRAERE